MTATVGLVIHAAGTDDIELSWNVMEHNTFQQIFWSSTGVGLMCFSLEDASQKILDPCVLIWLSCAHSRWIRSRRVRGHGPGDSAGDNIPGSDSTQGEVVAESTVPQHPQTGIQPRAAFVVLQAPAAFGLVSFLMHSGLEKKHIQGHLLAFSAAAPVVTIVTYFILKAVRNHPSSTVTTWHAHCLFIFLFFQKSLHPLGSNDSGPLEQHSAWLTVVVCCGEGGLHFGHQGG